MPLPTQQALELETLFLYFSAMSGVLAQKACWLLVHMTAISVTALSLNQLQELPAICVSLVRLSRLKWRKRSQAVYSVIYPWRNCALSPLPFSFLSFSSYPLETYSQKIKGLGELELYLCNHELLLNRGPITRFGCTVLFIPIGAF